MSQHVSFMESMMSKMKTAALMVAVAVSSVWIWNGLHDEPQVATTIQVVKEYVFAPPSAQASDTDMALASPLGRPITATPPAPTPVKASELGRKLLETKDVKAFVLEALKQPDKGGAFYATLALRQCSHLSEPGAVIQDVVARDSTITSDRMTKVNAMVDRCSQFSADDIGALQAEALRLGKEGKDPVMALQLQMTKTRAGTPERDALLESMFKANAALASDNFVAQRLLQQQKTVDADGSSPIYRFNGQTYTDLSDQLAIDMATRLSTCTGSDYCALDAEMVMMCKGMMGICYSSREEYLQETIFKGNQALIDKTARFTEQIRSAMARGDRSIFR